MKDSEQHFRQVRITTPSKAPILRAINIQKTPSSPKLARRRIPRLLPSRHHRTRLISAKISSRLFPRGAGGRDSKGRPERKSALFNVKIMQRRRANRRAISSSRAFVWARGPRPLARKRRAFERIEGKCLHGRATRLEIWIDKLLRGGWRGWSARNNDSPRRPRIHCRTCRQFNVGWLMRLTDRLFADYRDCLIYQSRWLTGQIAVYCCFLGFRVPFRNWQRGLANLLFFIGGWVSVSRTRCWFSLKISKREGNRIALLFIRPIYCRPDRAFTFDLPRLRDTL